MDSHTFTHTHTHMCVWMYVCIGISTRCTSVYNSISKRIPKASRISKALGQAKQNIHTVIPKENKLI